MPVPFAAIAAGAGALQGAYSLGSGIIQGIKARRMRKNRPAYEIPQALKDVVAKTGFEAARTGMSGESYLFGKAAQSSAGANRAITGSGQSTAAIIAGITGVDNNTKGMMADVGYRGEEIRRNNQSLYYASLNALAQEQKNQWQWDKQQPYLDTMAAQSALRGASMQNVYGGLGMLSDALGNIGAMNEYGAFSGGDNREYQINPGTTPGGVGGPVDTIPGQEDPAGRNYAGMQIENFNMDAARQYMESLYGPGITDEYIRMYYGLT